MCIDSPLESVTDNVSHRQEGLLPLLLVPLLRGLLPFPGIVGLGGFALPLSARSLGRGALGGGRDRPGLLAAAIGQLAVGLSHDPLQVVENSHCFITRPPEPHCDT